MRKWLFSSQTLDKIRTFNQDLTPISKIVYFRLSVESKGTDTILLKIAFICTQIRGKDISFISLKITYPNWRKFVYLCLMAILLPGTGPHISVEKAR